MKLGQLILIGGIGYGIYWLSKQADNVTEQLDIQFLGIKDVKVSILNTNFVAELRLINPALIPVNVQSISGNILFKEKSISTFNKLETFSLPAKGSSTIGIAVNLSNINLLTLLPSIGSVRNIDLKNLGLSIQGNVNLSSTTIPFTYAI